MLYWFGYYLLKFIFWLCGGIRYVGRENLPKSGGYIIAPNHISFADPPAAGCGTGRWVRFMAKQELFEPPVFGPIIRAVGAFPVRRGSADRKALRTAIEILQDGGVVCIFPEGTRSLDGKLGEPVPGLGMIALKAGVPVVPVAVLGTDKVLPPHAKRLYRHRMTVAYGKPLTFEDLAGLDSREAVSEVGRRLMSAISELREGLR